MRNNKLQFQQLNEKMDQLNGMQHVIVPPIGWIKAIRNGIGMSMEQLGKKLSITKQGVMDIEKREKEGNITLKNLREAANALDMHLVYALVPKDGSIENLIDRKARELATQIVSRTSNTMKLENQENTKQRLNKAVEERAAILKSELPKILWD